LGAANALAGSALSPLLVPAAAAAADVPHLPPGVVLLVLDAALGEAKPATLSSGETGTVLPPPIEAEKLPLLVLPMPLTAITKLLLLVLACTLVSAVELAASPSSTSGSDALVSCRQQRQVWRELTEHMRFRTSSMTDRMQHGHTIHDLHTTRNSQEKPHTLK
jgi:hypothetical protein